MAQEGTVIRELEAMKVGPNEVLIVRVRVPDYDDGSVTPNPVSEVERALRHVGLEDRSLIVTGDDIEFTVVDRGASGAFPA